jgi:hypothetical protein
MGSWKRISIPTDTLHLAKVAGEAAPGTSYAAAMRVRADGTRKGFLWIGVHGRLSAVVNGVLFFGSNDSKIYAFDTADIGSLSGTVLATLPSQ